MEALDYLAHYGVLRKSGRYPWGSGEHPTQRNKSFLDHVDALKRQGMSETDIAKAFSTEDHILTTTEIRAARAIARNEQRKTAMMQATKLNEKGMSNMAIARQMNLNESSVRALLKPALQEKANSLQNTADFLKSQIEEKKYLDVGSGTQNHMDISEQQLRTAIAMLREEGYDLKYVKVPQVGISGQFTTVKVLTKPDVPYSEVFHNPGAIKSVAGYSEDNGKSFTNIKPPVNIDPKRIEVKYGSEGGAQKDGVIELRRGVDDISLGASRYAQVRIAVNGTHYLKGMAMYADDLPAGTDIRFNTNKEHTGDKLDAMKPIKGDDSPFGAIIRQKTYLDASGKSHLSAINIVGTEDPEGNKLPGEEGGWAQWSKSLSSQMLSKQSPALAKQQLDLTYKAKQDQFDEIQSLTNPAVKKKLLQSFSDDVDSSATHLKAAALPRQATHVILPINTLKPTEVYAPNFKDGEKVVLVRYPHGGTFEIPELTVNNKHADAKRVMDRAVDAIGIHSKVAERLSGADFDGDTVLVIPNNSRAVKTTPGLKQLEGFNPQTAYPKYEGMKVMNARTKGIKMGDISNLITDMTIQGASQSELARAVKHSMVVIDAEKHKLNWQQSAKDNGISELKQKYQGKSNAGASTLISRASSQYKVPERKPRSAKNGGPIDPVTGRKVYENIDSSYTTKAGKYVPAREIKSTKMAETTDARTLIGKNPTVMETVYADHANKLKALANEARKVQYNTPNIKYNDSAKKVYSPQVASLKAKLNIALRNSPLERQAQLVANTIVKTKQEANPDMDAAELKKIKGMALTDARIRTGAKKQRINITPEEWAAIQAGAISNNFLDKILANTDLDVVKKYATPRTTTSMTSTQTSRAKAMYKSGFTQADIASQLGVSASTISKAIKEG